MCWEFLEEISLQGPWSPVEFPADECHGSCVCVWAFEGGNNLCVRLPAGRSFSLWSPNESSHKLLQLQNRSLHGCIWHENIGPVCSTLMPSPQQRTGCRTLWTTSVNPWHPRVISRTVVVVLGVWQDHTEAVLLREEGPEWLLKHVFEDWQVSPRTHLWYLSQSMYFGGKSTDRTRL